MYTIGYSSGIHVYEIVQNPYHFMQEKQPYYQWVTPNNKVLDREI